MNSETRLTLLAATLTLLGCSAEYHSKKGREALDQHDLAGAEKQYRSAIEKDPTLGEALAGLGWTYQIAGKTDAAAGAFDRCLEARPEEVSCLRGKANVLLSKGQAADAAALIATAVKLAPDDPGVASSQALLEMTQGNLDSAAKRYQALLERFPTAAEYRVGYGEVLLRQKKNTEALAIVDEALKMADTPVRYVAQLHLLRARALVASTSGRVNPKDCAGTAPAVLAWLDSADASVKAAIDTETVPTTAAKVQRLVGRRRGAVEDRCPGLAGTSAGGALPTLTEPPARPGSPPGGTPADAADGADDEASGAVIAPEDPSAPAPTDTPAPAATPAPGAPH